MQLENIVLVVRNARGKVQVARYILEQESSIFKIKRFTGQYGGKITTQPELTIEKGKAKRTVLQQARLEFDSLVKKCTDKGYKKLSTLTKTKFEDLTVEEMDKIVPSEKTDANGNVKPQLAKSSNDCANSVMDKEHFASSKLDGVRNLTGYNIDEGCVYTISRGGGNYDVATTAIRQDPQLLDFFRRNPTIILDGELYVHGWPLQRISGAARLKTWDEEKCGPLQYWIYDIVDTENTFNNRLDTLIDMEIEFEGNEKIKIVKHEHVQGWSSVKRLHDKYVQEGYEGLVLRNPYKVYSPGKRSSDWIKVKDYKDGEFEITGISDGLRPEDMCFTLKTAHGKSFKAKPIGDRALKKEYLENWEDMVGKMATVKYFAMSEDGVPMQPTFKCVRAEDE